LAGFKAEISSPSLFSFVSLYYNMSRVIERFEAKVLVG
jgi:hypothetical protein